jgi:AraC-like DNA-binding protein/mannose-6-phosphate isomerase-like protein (cupin superfamily)
MYREQKKSPYFPRADVPVGLWRQKDQKPIHVHDHDFMEIAIVESGRGMHRFDGAVLPIESGDAFILPPGCQHAWVETDDLTVINVMIDALDDLPHIHSVRQHPGFDGFFNHAPTLENQQQGRGRLRLNINQLKEVTRIAQHLDDALHDAEGVPAELVEIELLYLLTILCEAYAKAPSRSRQITLRVNHVIRYLDDHFTEDITADELADSMHLSLATFYRLFREATGTTPVQYVNALRLDKACEYLRKTDSTVMTIAFDVGFNDSNYFSRLFRKHKGVSPQQYRKEG